MKAVSVTQLLPCVLFLTILFAWPVAESAMSPVAVRADLTHVDSGRGFTKRELLSRMAARSRARVASLYSSARPGSSARTVTVPAARRTVGRVDINSEYLIHFSIGTLRPQRVALELDTGSDLIWTQCACVDCFDQWFPVLNTSASRTLRDVSCSDPPCVHVDFPLTGCNANGSFCSYVYSYADKSFTRGKIVVDTFTFKAPHGKRGAVAVVPNLHFGCGMSNKGLFKSNESGIAGFGRGPMSLPSQLKVHRFSHCLTTMVESRTSPVFLGTPDNLEAQATGPVQSTPFARNPAGGPFYYYLSLKGVTVGKKRLPFDASAFALKGDGSGGTIIDSGTSMTSFPRSVFRRLQEAFMSQVPLPIANATTTDADSMLCFSLAPKKKVPAVPKLILHLEGADWDLPRENYMLDVDDDDCTGRELCVVILPASESDGTTIGNFQQQNMHIVYDLESNKMVFAPARCDKL